ncbi:MAG: murein biosynthesis integral membrane protein MurJ [Gaiellales bacterium]|nr:MAG: murein biosynthesis integral membrane protein MurJ [Gaiellales bacterium]
MKRTEGPAAPGRRLATAALIVVAATAASRVFGYVREIAAAAYYGAGAAKSAFDVAFLIPSTVQVLVAQAALTAALIPVLSGLIEKGERQEAWRVARTVFTLVAIILGATVIICIIFAPRIMPLFAPGYRGDAAMMADIVYMTRLLFPTVVLLAITGVVVSILNSYEHFTLPALAPVFWNVVIVAAIVAGSDRFGIEAMAWGVLLGTLVQLAMQLPWLRGRGGRLGLSLDLKNRHVRQVGALMLPVSLSLGLINLNGVVDVQFASYLGDGAVAAMNYAFRLYQLPEALFAIAVGTVLFPTLSKLAARGDRDGFRDSLTRGLRVIFFLLIPISAFILVLSEPLVRLAYEHGRFTPEDTRVVGSTLFFFAFGSAFSGGSALLTRGFFSLSQPWTPTVVALGNIAVNALLNWILIRWFDLGGIALSTTLVSTVTFFILLFMMRRRLGRIDGRAIVRSALTVTLFSALAALAAYAAWRGVDFSLGRGLAGQLLSLSAALATCAAIMAILSRASGLAEWRLLLTLRRS